MANGAQLRRQALAALQLPLLNVLETIEDYVWGNRYDTRSPSEALELLDTEAAQAICVADDVRKLLADLFPSCHPRTHAKPSYTINADGSITLTPPQAAPVVANQASQEAVPPAVPASHNAPGSPQTAQATIADPGQTAAKAGP
jgi:hypothetical protein